MSTSSAAAGADHSDQPGQAVYTPFFLKYVYDPLVVRFANRFTWRCPSSTILELYASCLSTDHLEVGPGTGWYLRNARFPGPRPRLALLDLNRDVLARSAARLARYQPELVRADLLRPIDLGGRQFDSVALAHVLHCLPGPMPAKAVALDHLRPLIRPGGKLFGSTILSGGVPQTRLSRDQLARMNAQRVFDNTEDSLAALDAALAQRFTDYQVRPVGSVALFVASV